MNSEEKKAAVQKWLKRKIVLSKGLNSLIEQEPIASYSAYYKDNGNITLPEYIRLAIPVFKKIIDESNGYSEHFEQELKNTDQLLEFLYNIQSFIENRGNYTLGELQADCHLMAPVFKEMKTYFLYNYENDKKDVALSNLVEQKSNSTGVIIRENNLAKKEIAISGMSSIATLLKRLDQYIDSLDRGNSRQR